MAELKVNLTLLLTSETALQLQRIPDLPTEEDMLRVLDISVSGPGQSSTHKNNTTQTLEETDLQTQQPDSPEVYINEPCIVILDSVDKREWFVGICISDNNDCTYTIW